MVQFNDLTWGKYCSLQFLPAPPSSPSLTLEGHFDTDTVTFKGPQRNKDTVRRAALGVQFLGQRQRQLTETLIVRLLKMHFSSLILDCEKSELYRS